MLLSVTLKASLPTGVSAAAACRLPDAFQHGRTQSPQKSKLAGAFPGPGSLQRLQYQASVVPSRSSCAAVPQPRASKAKAQGPEQRVAASE